MKFYLLEIRLLKKFVSMPHLWRCLMNKRDELNVKEELESENANITPSDEAVIANLGIQPTEIKSIKPSWKRSQYRAVINWLTKYNPAINASNLETVKGLLEAFHHLCAVEDIERAWSIIHCRLNTPTQEYLDEQLQSWGYYKESKSLYSHLLDKPLDNIKAAILLDRLGVIYSSQGYYNLAIDYHKKSLERERQSPGILQPGDIYCNLSFCYFNLNNLNKAIEYANKSLKIAKETPDERLKSKSLHHRGKAYFCSEIDDEKAISDIKEAISIAKRIQADFLIGRMTGDLASVYSQLCMYEEAYEMYKQRLDIAISRRPDKRGEAITLCNLGNLSQKMEKWDEGIEYLDKAIHISKEIPEQHTEAQSHYFLSLIYEQIDDKDRAIAESKQAYRIAQSLQIPLAEECQELMKRLTNS